MKIRKDSWHYRFLKWSYPNSKLVGFTKKGVRYETAEQFKNATGWLPSEYSIPPEIGESLPRMSLCSYFRELVATIFIGLPVMGLMGIMFSPLFVICYIEEKWEKWSIKKPKQPKLPREPKTLLGKWLKAKKDKVCPILEYE